MAEFFFSGKLLIAERPPRLLFERAALVLGNKSVIYYYLPLWGLL
jgi:hypothetical protein